MEITNDALTAADSDHITLFILLETPAAFGTISHTIPLHAFDNTGVAVLWFQAPGPPVHPIFQSHIQSITISTSFHLKNNFRCFFLRPVSSIWTSPGRGTLVQSSGRASIRATPWQRVTTTGSWIPYKSWITALILLLAYKFFHALVLSHSLSFFYPPSPLPGTSAPLEWGWPALCSLTPVPESQSSEMFSRQTSTSLWTSSKRQTLSAFLSLHPALTRHTQMQLNVNIFMRF